MTLVQKVILKKNSEVSQKINLAELFGKDIDKRSLDLVASAIVEFIINRSQSGIDRHGKDFKDYTEKYAQIKGVSVGEVDMTLVGDMLDSINYDLSKGTIKIQVGDEDVAKAYGHMTGFKGHPTIKDGPKREFFGIDEKDLIKIMEGINIDETPSEKQELDNIIKGLRLE